MEKTVSYRCTTVHYRAIALVHDVFDIGKSVCLADDCDSLTDML